MGVIIDFETRLDKSRKHRRADRDVHRVSLRVAQGFVAVVEREITQQLYALLDETSASFEVEEASNTLPTLNEMLRDVNAYLLTVERLTHDDG